MSAAHRTGAACGTPAAPRTLWDAVIGCQHPKDEALNWALHDIQVESDRRDAQLMRKAQALRAASHLFLAARYGSIELEGVLMSGRRLGVRYLDTDSVCVVSGSCAWNREP